MPTQYGLALGGGAARGLAHIGVIQYIQEKNISIEEVAGTSMGAIIAACFALGYSAKKISQIAQDMNYLSLIDFNMKSGIVKGDKVLKKLEEIFGETTIQDTPIPLKIVATNLNTGTKTIFSQGKISDAVRASISLPSIFQPHTIGNSEYIDGGITSNLPIETLQSTNIIAVSALKDVGTDIVTQRKIFQFSFQKSFFSINYQILQKTIIILMQQNELASLNTQNKNIILLKPEYGELDYFHFQKTEQFITIGYKIAKNKLGEIL